MSEQEVPTAERVALTPQQSALVVSVLLYVVLYLWGVIWGLSALAEREPED